MKRRDWRKELVRRRKQQEKRNARLKKIAERKKRRKPWQWGPEEKSNPDWQWMEFLKMKDMYVHREITDHSLQVVKAYLKVSRKIKRSPEEPLNRGQRRRLLKEMRDYMIFENAVPDLRWLRLKYKELKKL